MDHLGFEMKIREELIKDNLIEENDKLSFELSLKRLVINGQKQPANLREKYLQIYETHSNKPLSGETRVIIQD